MQRRLVFDVRIISALVIGLLMLTCGLGFTRAQEADTMPPDFRSYRWGDSFWDIGDGFQELGESNRIVTYRKIRDDLFLGSLRAEYIGYLFFDNRLLGVIIGIRDADTNRAKEMLITKYGKPIDEDRLTDNSSWATERTYAVLDDEYLNSRITLIGAEMAAEYEAWRKEQAAKDAAAW